MDDFDVSTLSNNEVFMLHKELMDSYTYEDISKWRELDDEMNHRVSELETMKWPY